MIALRLRDRDGPQTPGSALFGQGCFSGEEVRGAPAVAGLSLLFVELCLPDREFYGA